MRAINARTTRSVSKPPFVVDESACSRDTGRQIDWDLLDGRFVHDAEVIEVTANADIDDTTLAVVALPKAVPAGTILDFGLRAAILVTLSGNEAIGQTAIGVTALPGALRSGAILTSGAGEFMKLTADAAAGATEITVEALEVAWESADTATYPAIQQLVRVTADAAEGATELTVQALEMWIDDAAVTTLGSQSGGRFVPAGTEMDLLSSGKIVPSVLATGGVTCYGLLVSNADEESRTDAITGYGVYVGGRFYENLLPGSSGSPKVINSTHKTELLARGMQWGFEQYTDNTV